MRQSLTNIAEANRSSQRAHKAGRVAKEGPKSKVKDEPSAYVTVGLPGSGKSTIAKHMVSKGKTDQHELDKSRQALGKGPAYFGADIVKHTFDGAKKSAEKGRNTVLSNTSIPKQHRQDAIDKLRDSGYDNVKAVLSPGSTKAAMRRNRKRTGSKPGEGAVPQFVMNRMAQGMKQLKRSDRRELRANYKQLHKTERFTKPAMKRTGAIREQITFLQFLELAEKYYAPDEKLPSGNTPLGKALKKQAKNDAEIGPKSDTIRMRRHSEKIETKVKHGADNPNYNTSVHGKDDDEIRVDSDGTDYLTVHHKPSKVTYDVEKLIGPGNIHGIAWSHEREHRKTLSPSERNSISRDARRVWDQHVSHRLPHGAILHNRPAREGLGKIYKRAGFGPVDDENDQFARIGREKSPKQKSKGKKSRLSPLDPKKTKRDTYWY